MASLRRSNNMPSDSATSKFLYTILKQLEHKSIDWNSVAAELDITNGHAARMRFSRFKQHQEGIPPIPRKPKSPNQQVKKPRLEKREQRTKAEPMETVKREPTEPRFARDTGMDMDAGPLVKPEPVIKDEPAGEYESQSPLGTRFANFGFPGTSYPTMLGQPEMVGSMELDAGARSHRYSVPSLHDPRIKLEMS